MTYAHDLHLYCLFGDPSVLSAASAHLVAVRLRLLRPGDAVADGGVPAMSLWLAASEFDPPSPVADWLSRVSASVSSEGALGSSFELRNGSI